MALTATATQEVRRDICRSLNLKDPVTTCTGFDRYNQYVSLVNYVNFKLSTFNLKTIVGGEIDLEAN